ncbi:hypothetical protein [Pandoraea sp. NPDC090278]|uniref:hypothetical protein n=1 Tax=Pandoraea sp. NPDC090278 TaxID=3364391 RepID=UPI00383B48F3
MRLLRLLAARSNDPASLCSETPSAQPDWFQMSRTMSPKDFDRNMTLLELVTRQAPNVAEEHYDLGARLEANAWLHKLESKVESSPDTSTTRDQVCRGIRAMVAGLDKMPESEQRRTSYEVFRVMQRKTTAAASIVASPQRYFDETFDEKALPATLRRRLPADGSHPLPFKRIVFEGRWVSELAGESGPVRNIFVNRRNNGVIAEMTEAGGTDSENARVSYALSYGFQGLRNQLVIAKWAYHLSQLRTFPDVPLKPGDALPVPGSLIQAVATEPPLSGDYLPVNQCEIGESRPASEIAQGLSGVAVSVQCVSPRPGKGPPYMDRSVWLQDYGVGVNLEWRVDGLAGSFQIDKVVVE